MVAWKRLNATLHVQCLCYDVITVDWVFISYCFLNCASVRSLGRVTLCSINTTGLRGREYGNNRQFAAAVIVVSASPVFFAFRNSSPCRYLFTDNEDAWNVTFCRLLWAKPFWIWSKPVCNLSVVSRSQAVFLTRLWKKVWRSWYPTN